MNRDKIFKTPFKEISPFKFDSQVASVFDDMAERSIPMYNQVQKLSALLCSNFTKQNTAVYDLGCSTGNTLIEIARAIKDKSIEIIGIDNSPDMLKVCNEKLVLASLEKRVKTICENIQDAHLKTSSVVLLNYTLQFIPVQERSAFLKSIFNSICTGGCVIISEKIRYQDMKLEQAVTNIYYTFKEENGYSKLEIAQKRKALEKVLTPLTEEQNIQLLKDAGFSSVELLCKWYNFSSFIAVK